MNRRRSLLLATVMSCSGASLRPEAAGTHTTVETKPNPGIRTQGSQIEGGALEAAVFAGELDSAGAAAAATGPFSGAGGDRQLLSATVEQAALDPCPSPSGALRLYRISVNGKNPCSGQPLALDRQDRTLSTCEREHFDAYTAMAVALPGTFAQGAYLRPAQPPQFTLSCISGVVAKCLRWGYRPASGGSTKDLLQTCVRAARADYCGTGGSYTCPGTRVDIVDRQKIQVRAPDPGGEVLEADWGPDGALCLNFARLPGCSAANDQAALKRRIVAECKDQGHPLDLDACPRRCPAGDATCGRLIRTWTFKEQVRTCETSGRCSAR